MAYLSSLSCLDFSDVDVRLQGVDSKVFGVGMLRLIGEHLGALRPAGSLNFAASLIAYSAANESWSDSLPIGGGELQNES